MNAYMGRQPHRRDRNVKHGLTNAASHEPPFRFHDALKSRSNRNPPSLWTCRGSMIMGRVIRIAAGNWISRYRDRRIFRSKGGVETDGGSSNMGWILIKLAQDLGFRINRLEFRSGRGGREREWS